MPAFEDLGLREELLRTLEDEDLTQPTALQEAVIPALRRGGNLVARASAGAGKTLAFGLGVLDRLQAAEGGEDAEEGEGGSGVVLRFLVLAPTVEESERIALALFPYAQAVGMSVTVPGGSWGTPASAAEVVVGPPAELLAAVRASSLKLDDLEAVVVDNASTILELGDWDTVDTLLDHLPRDAQRVVVSTAFPEPVEDLVERRVKRALRFPAEAAIPEAATAPRAKVGYVLAAAQEKLDVLARQLGAVEERTLPPVIFCRSDERAADLAEQLSVRGFVVGAADDAEADVALVAGGTTREELGPELGQTISFDVPPDARTLQERHRDDASAVVLVEPRQVPHLREIARQANWQARPVAMPVETGPTAQRLGAFREQLRRALHEEDLAAQTLVLEPLFEEFPAVEVAAALAALLRRRAPAAPAPQAQQPASAPAAAPASRAASSEPGPAPATWARLFVSIGSRDEIRPGDLVGALAGESNVPGAKIGKIEIRDTFSIVEVQADVADQVIRAVNGISIKGRSVRVDYDRGGERARGNAPPRRGGPGGGGGGGGGGSRGGPGGRPGGARRVVRKPPRD